MALATVERLSFAYPDAADPALVDVSLCIEPGEVVLVLGRSGSGKSTLLRALAGLVPHFHGGRFGGVVRVGGHDTRSTPPALIAGTVAAVFQDPEDQIVFDHVASEVAFGAENLGRSQEEVERATLAALEAVGATHLLERRTAELSGGELQRVCLAGALAMEPQLLLLDEPTSQLDPEAAERFLELAAELARARGMAVVLSEQRPARPLAVCDRVLFVDRGRLAFDGPRAAAVDWLARHERAFVLEPPARGGAVLGASPTPSEEWVCRLRDVEFAYPGQAPVLAGETLELRRGEIVALLGPNGAGKTTLAKIAAGLLDAQSGEVERAGRATYLSQDPGRYVVCERAIEEVALGVGGDLGRARRALAEVGLSDVADRHPRDLSSGQRERLALASVLVTEPDLLILDEPTRGVDPPRKLELAALLVRDAQARATLLVTHDESFARSLADRVIRLGAAVGATPEATAWEAEPAHA